MAQGTQPDELLTVREVADALRVSTMTVYRLIRSSELASLRVGKGYRIRPADLDRYLAVQLSKVPSSPPGV